MIIIKSYRAIAYPEKCHAFLVGHRKVLEDFNLENISTNTPRWINHLNTYVIIAEYNGEIIAGARMQIADDEFALPVSDAVSHFDPKIDDLILHKRTDGNAAELCGLWNSRKLHPKLGITMIVSMAAVSLAKQINTKNIFAICAGYTLRSAMKMGFQVEKGVGNNGEFVYPNSNFTARVLSMNGFNLENTYTEYKDEIELIRNSPIYSRDLKFDQEIIPLIYENLI